jgi:two-component system, chemotaxis family, chemotaxis protein CheY
MSYSILVVDDSPLIRKMMKRSLGLSKLEVGTVHEATNGKEALAVLEKEWIDVVLADIHMPVMSGTELIELMSRDQLLGKIPVVVVSAERSEPAIDHLKKLGICAHLRKPFTPEQVLEVINSVLDEVAKKAIAS